MNAVWRMIVLTMAVVLSSCTAFTVSPAVRQHGQGVSTPRASTTTTPTLVAPRTARFASPAGGACRTFSRPSMSATEPRSGKHDVQRAAAMAAVTSVATLTGAAVPAHAENFSQFFAQGLVGAMNGPGLLAVPIVLGFLLASSVAAFIFFFSQPREYDE